MAYPAAARPYLGERPAEMPVPADTRPEPGMHAPAGCTGKPGCNGRAGKDGRCAAHKER